MSFDEQANSWDTQTRKERAIILADKIRDNINNEIGLQGSTCALEIGCGTGLISMNLIDDFELIHCVDESGEMIKVLQGKIENGKVENIYTHNLDFLQEDTYFEKFDVIYSSMVFHHINNIDTELKLLSKFLKDDGRIIVIDLDKEDGTFHKNEEDFHGHNGFDRQEFKVMCKNAGFADTNIQTVYEGEKKIDEELMKYSLFICVAKRETQN